jgi:hypothetical protein
MQPPDTDRTRHVESPQKGKKRSAKPEKLTKPVKISKNSSPNAEPYVARLMDQKPYREPYEASFKRRTDTLHGAWCEKYTRFYALRGGLRKSFKKKLPNGQNK